MRLLFFCLMIIMNVNLLVAQEDVCTKFIPKENSDKINYVEYDNDCYISDYTDLEMLNYDKVISYNKDSVCSQYSGFVSGYKVLTLGEEVAYIVDEDYLYLIENGLEQSTDDLNAWIQKQDAENKCIDVRNNCKEADSFINVNLAPAYRFCNDSDPAVNVLGCSSLKMLREYLSNHQIGKLIAKFVNFLEKLPGGLGNYEANKSENINKCVQNFSKGIEICPIIFERTTETFPRDYIQAGKAQKTSGRRGFLYINGKGFYAIERADGFTWVKPGTYDCKMEYFSTASDPNTKKKGIRIYGATKSDGTPTGNLIHSANWPEQLLGCIAPGISKKTDGVNDSVLALTNIFDELGGFEEGKTCKIIVKGMP